MLSTSPGGRRRKSPFNGGGSARRKRIPQIAAAKKRTKGSELLIKARNESKQRYGGAETKQEHPRLDSRS